MKTNLETKAKLKQEAKQLLQTFENLNPAEGNYLCVLSKEDSPTLHKTLIAKFRGFSMINMYWDLIIKNGQVDKFCIIRFDLRKLYLSHIVKYGRLPADKTVGKFISILLEKGEHPLCR